MLNAQFGIVGSFDPAAYLVRGETGSHPRRQCILYGSKDLRYLLKGFGRFFCRRDGLDVRQWRNVGLVGIAQFLPNGIEIGQQGRHRMRLIFPPLRTVERCLVVRV